MLSVFLRSARSAISTQFSSPQLNVSFIHKSVSRKVFLNNLHTSRPKQAAFPPVVLLLLRPVLKGIAFFAGRNFRKWWQALPKERRAKYWAKIKEKRWNLVGMFVHIILIYLTFTTIMIFSFYSFYSWKCNKLWDWLLVLCWTSWKNTFNWQTKILFCFKSTNWRTFSDGVYNGKWSEIKSYLICNYYLLFYNDL